MANNKKKKRRKFGKLNIADVSNSLSCKTCVWHKSANPAAPCPACFGMNKHHVATL